MRKLAALFRRLTRDRRGASAVEYGFILALIVLALITSLTALADVTTGMWNNVSDEVVQATS
ncbi:Flp family type IVb pilin [Stakelama tenebrarum]|uniref:Flp family type IVb pilin n=1 Tax=Stakelama tenebrarum TaxID=2711215 RepID=A0A6G6Y7X9_9SPHN|nr:Flp family type IVb pilin [Sphingosinithalassobacter tenebrarum]QIG81019.1 Flp family type IVb pilin [Sphingosinithalassobacter tenebrarum]